MVWLGSVLCEQELECDELKDNLCNNCNACVNICPVNALEQGMGVLQLRVPIGNLHPKEITDLQVGKTSVG